MTDWNKFFEDKPYNKTINYFKKQNIIVRTFGIKREVKYVTPNGTKVFFGYYYSFLGRRYWYKNIVVTEYSRKKYRKE